jgi:hypothetical protein
MLFLEFRINQVLQYLIQSIMFQTHSSPTYFDKLRKSIYKIFHPITLCSTLQYTSELAASL